jgi:uncharacterized membrane protein
MAYEIQHCQLEMAKAVAVHEKQIHQLFVISVTLKGFHALIEIVGGAALALFSTDTIVRWLYSKSDQSSDLLARFARTFTGAEHHFYAFYLVSHGVLNLAIVAALLSRKLWAYPATFAVLIAFVAYQLYRYTYTHDIGLIAITLIDLIVLALACNEYRLMKRAHTQG